MHTLRILHISDLHAQGKGDGKRIHKRERVLGDAWRRNLDELAEDGRAFDLVVFTGDIAEHGLAEEYAAATPFIQKTLERLGVPPGRFFVVPGNHDVHRPTEVGAWTKLREGIHEHDQAVSEWLADSDSPHCGFEPTWRDAVLQREQAFWTWVKRDLGRSALLPASSHHGRLGYSVSVPGLAVPVQVIGLDSAWLAGDDRDAGSLWLTDDQLGLLCRNREGVPWPGFRLALVHHPLSALADEEAAARELGDTVDLLLRGHQHAPVARERADPDRTMRELAAGCLYAGTRRNRRHNACQVIDVVLDDSGRPLRYEIRFRAWSPRGHWHDDSSLYREARDGRLVWRNDGRDAPSRSPARGGGAAVGPSRDPRYERYCRAAQAHHRNARFVGMAIRRPESAVAMEHLFVPLRLSNDGHTQTTKIILERLHSASGTDAARFVILGSPGAGKSSLCHFVALSLASRTLAGDLRPILPLLLPLRDYGRNARDRSLLEFLVEHARTSLQLTDVDMAFLDSALREGKAALLLDGLDEAGEATRRVEIRDRIQSFCAAYPNMPVLITSRPEGYRDAPLDQQLFHRLNVEPFSDDEVHEVVQRWYRAVLPHDALAQRARASDLCAALDAAPEVRELARTPLLAILAVAIYHSTGRLPDRPSDLYERCITTLLETWPRSREQRFDELDDAYQRIYIEELAWHQWNSPHERKVTDHRDTLVTALTECMLERHLRGGEREVARRLARRWLEYLTQDTGLLIEYEPDLYDFAHLSFAEYLVVSRLTRTSEGSLPEVLAARWHESASNYWQVCRLALDQYGSRPGFIDRFITALDDRRRDFPYAFLLECMSSGIAFTAEQVGTLLNRLVREPALAPGIAAEEHDTSLRIPSGASLEIQGWAGALGRAMRHSPANAAHIERWFHQLLDRGERTLVHAALMLLDLAQVNKAFNDLRTEDRDSKTHRHGIHLRDLQAHVARTDDRVSAMCATRADREEIAGLLLDFWPTTAFGAWAAQTVGPTAALAWAREQVPFEHRIAYAITALALPARASLVAALTVALVERAIWAGIHAARAAVELAHEDCPGGRGLPRVVTIANDATSIDFRPRLPSLREGMEAVSAPAFGPEARKDFLTGLDGFPKGMQLLVHWINDRATQAARHLPRLTRPALGDYFAEEAHTRHLHTGEIPQDIRAFDMMGCDAKQMFERLGERPTLAWSWNDARAPRPPRTRCLHGDTIFAYWHGEARPLSLTGYLTAISAAEALIALATSVHSIPQDRLHYLACRQQNRWLIELWPGVEGFLLGGPMTGEHLALYLALGWTQYTTTGEWPRTELWEQLFTNGLPASAHWLARYHWYLCWLAYEPDNPLHRRELWSTLAEDRARDDIHANIRDLLRGYFC